jgi:hypothetical protein
MNRLSQIASMDLNMLHLTMGNVIVNNLYRTLVNIVYFSQGINKKAKFSKKLAYPYYFSRFLNETTIFFLCGQQGDYLFFLV